MEYDEKIHDLFSAPSRPLTCSEFIDRTINAPWNYHKSAAIDFEHQQWQLKYFKPSEEIEHTLSSVEIGLADWGGDYSKRRAIEKKTAAYIREKVVPTGLLLDAESIAERLEGCRNSGILGFVQSSGRKVVRWSEKCGLKNLCPDESRGEQKRLARRYVPACESWLKSGKRRRFQYAVFEPINIPVGELQTGMREAYHQLRLMLRHESFKNVAGTFTALECPLSRDGKSWNVHINCLFLIDGRFDWQAVREEYGQRIHFESTESIIEKTTNYLQKRNGGEPTTATRADVLTCAFREIIKYSSKHVSAKGEAGKTDAPGITEWPPELFVEWYAAHKGLRRCRSYGVLHGIGKPEREQYEVTWIGSMQYDCTSRLYHFHITGRPSVISLQGDKSTTNRAQNGRQNHLFKPDAPPGGK